MLLSIPELTLPSTHGDIALADLRGTPFVLFFYPRDDTPGCTTENIDFTALMGDFDTIGVKLFGVSKDTLEKHKKFMDKKALRVPLLSDAQTNLCEHMGVWTQKQMFGKAYMGIARSTFLFGVDGTVYQEWRKVKVPGHAADVLQAAQQLTGA